MIFFLSGGDVNTFRIKESRVMFTLFMFIPLKTRKTFMIFESLGVPTSKLLYFINGPTAQNLYFVKSSRYQSQNESKYYFVNDL